MSVGTIILSALLLVLCVVIICVVLLQEGHQANLSGAIAGGADSFLGKNKGRTIDQFLSKWTKWIAIIFFILVLVADFVTLMAR